ncbi:hypothetical protein [Rubrivirga sp. IMCC45206]|uniref:hypothetical protein n=1 Tax=Rubrivirga sp. IMCC45206 TaxID=3391614 RepID=UPI00398FC194
MRPLLLAAALVLSGCAATHSVAAGDDFGALNARLAGRDAIVVLTDGTAYDAAALRVGPDSTTWIDPRTQALLAIPTSAIAEVERRDRQRALRRSVRLGVISGVSVGGAMGAAAGFESGGCLIFCGGDPTIGDRLKGAGGFGLAGAAVGLVYGALFGAAAGLVSDSAERFRFDLAPPTAAERAPTAQGR